MQDLNDFYYFVQVVDHQGFASAGRALGVPKSRLSRRIAELEARLEVRLIQRSTRQFAVTELGQSFYQHCQAMLWQAEAAVEVVERHQSEPRGRIRISCPPSLLTSLFTPILSAFMKQYPLIALDVVATSRRVDIVREGFDLAIRVRYPPLEDSDLVMRRLCASPQLLLAAPVLLERMGKPKIPQDLSDWPSLDFEEPERRHVWRLDGPGGMERMVEHRPRLVSDDVGLLVRSAMDGLGVARLPLVAAGRELERGHLVDVLPGWTPRSGLIHAVYASRRGQLPSVRTLLAFLDNALDETDTDSRKGWYAIRD
ncbi:LysR family transcriptional regulator [Halomonas denitrificans]|uniref:LysR substrate-binding domain-containing protein n=1 Tax=Halomonas denitrificans TaxID=370769 RepID=UPI001CD7C619|nr:LysR substrate-binding domain-containing protein [Halomonas denitrificans]MCA0973002.1 LysR family transcriptional regulator [Halomonas denitrificans]